jgi:hypothetical protein
MSVHRLGAHQLPAAEVILVRTLLRLFAHDQGFRWRFVDEPPYDALIVDGNGSTQPDQAASRQARAVLTLTRSRETNERDCLTRPLRAERLKQWLEGVQVTLLETRAAPLPEAARETGQAEPEIAFKLRRWPPVSLLRRDPARIRMATLMSRRHMKVSELASVTGLSPEDIQPFVHNLKLVGLVDMRRSREAAPPPPSSTHPSAKPEVPAAPTKGFFGKGLIGGIRKRLGL